MDPTQKYKPMAVKTPLGDDALLLVSIVGQEALSQLFTYELKVVAPITQEVPFEKLLGKSVTVEMELPGSRTPREKKRYFNGICSSISELGGDDEFTEYVLRLVPRLWLLTQRSGSRVFQHKTLLDILSELFLSSGGDAQIELNGITGLEDRRDYCVQYRETDFNFLSRLFEEEGIYYYFVHEDGKHTMVAANTPAGHRELPFQSEVLCSSGVATADEDRVISWSKTQEIRARNYVLRDHCFELVTGPGRFQNLEVKADGQKSVSVGDVEHRLSLNPLADATIYDYPGEYAQRFDGIDAQGGEQADKLGSVQPDGKRTVGIRMQQETGPSLLICGSGTCRQFQAGHWFTRTILQEEEERLLDGDFILTGVSHQATQPGYRSAATGSFRYLNTFTAIPDGLPFAPPRRTPKPIIQGTQTAVVVGLVTDDDIFTDKYGRVKVQFHWDREGKFNADSSCWVRVATPLAGPGWGMIHIPRVGQEVVVGFEEGDPDRPIILGCVYNAGMMPPYDLPDNRTQSGYKSRSSAQGTEEEFNEFRFEDKKGEEKIFCHAQKDFEKVVENSYTLIVGPKNDLGASHLIVEQSENQQKLEIVVGPKGEYGACGFIMDQHHSSPLEQTLAISIADKHDFGAASIQMDQTKPEQKMLLQIAPKHDFGPANIAFNQTKMHQSIELATGPGGAFGPASVKLDKTPMEQYIQLKLGKCSIKMDQKPAMESIEIKVADNSIKIDQTGITIKGLMVKVEGEVLTALKGLITQFNADAMMQVKGAVTMIG